MQSEICSLFLRNISIIFPINGSIRLYSLLFRVKTTKISFWNRLKSITLIIYCLIYPKGNSKLENHLKIKLFNTVLKNKPIWQEYYVIQKKSHLSHESESVQKIMAFLLSFNHKKWNIKTYVKLEKSNYSKMSLYNQNDIHY